MALPENLSTDDLAVPSDSDDRMAELQGSATSVSLAPGALLRIAPSVDPVTNSGFTRDNGPTLIFD